jgi:hypothetical protein
MEHLTRKSTPAATTPFSVIRSTPLLSVSTIENSNISNTSLNQPDTGNPSGNPTTDESECNVVRHRVPLRDWNIPVHLWPGNPGKTFLHVLSYEMFFLTAGNTLLEIYSIL